MKRLLILVLLVGKLCFATDYYVSPTGSNSNDGRSEDQAWKTIAHAASKVRAGDTVWVKAGTYTGENVVFANSQFSDVMTISDHVPRSVKQPPTIVIICAIDAQKPIRNLHVTTSWPTPITGILDSQALAKRRLKLFCQT